MFVYKVYTEFHTNYTYDVTFSKKESLGRGQNESISTLEVDEEKVPLIIDKSFKYSEAFSEKVDSKNGTTVWTKPTEVLVRNMLKPVAVFPKEQTVVFLLLTITTTTTKTTTTKTRTSWL